jgi:predicted ABC-class ATPase
VSHSQEHGDNLNEVLWLQVTLPHRGVVRGMGIRRGITLIAGGGFHGKSTLLQALEAGVYNKVGGGQC